MANIANLIIKLSADTGPAEKGISSFSGKMSKVGKGFNKALIPAVGILGGIAVAAKKTTDAASNLEESQNAVDVVFGKSAKTVHNFAKVADQEAGLSMRQFNELVTPIGASLTNMGDGADVAADKSVNLAKRAADMASVFGGPVSDALGAIQAGLRGEADPLERFGVGLSDVAVRAQAVEMGLAKTTAAVDDADKGQARYALILEQTANVQGDFVRTSDGAANSAKKNAAAQENLQGKMGTGLLPVVETVNATIGKLTGLMAKNTGATKVVIGVMAGLAATIVAANIVLSIMSSRIVTSLIPAIVKTTFVQRLLNLTILGFPLFWIVAALVALGVALVVLWKKSETFRNIVNGVWSAVRSAASAAFAAIRSIVSGAFNFIKGVASRTPLAAFIRHISGARETIASILSAIRSAFSTAFGAIRGIVGGLAGALESVISAAYRAADAVRSIPTPGDALGKIGSIAGKIPGFAGGVHNFGGGLAVVGERGPELVNLPRGSDVHTNAESRGRLLGGGGDVIVNVYGDVTGEELIEKVRVGLSRKGQRNVRVQFGT